MVLTEVPWQKKCGTVNKGKSITVDNELAMLKIILGVLKPPKIFQNSADINQLCYLACTSTWYNIGILCLCFLARFCFFPFAGKGA